MGQTLDDSGLRVERARVHRRAVGLDQGRLLAAPLAVYGGV